MSTPEPAPARKKIPSWLVSATLSLVAFALLGLAVWSNREQIAEVFRGRIDYRLFAVALAINLTGLMLTFVRWYVLVRALGLPFRLLDAIRLGFIGNVFNLVVPGAVGGDFIKGAFLVREQARKTQAVASMVIDRVLGLLGLFVLGGISGAWAWPGATPPVRTLIGLVWLAVAAGFAGLAVLFTPALYRPLERLFARRAKLATMLSELAAMAGAYRSKPGTIVAMLAMAVGTHSLAVLSFYCVSRALFATVPTLGEHFLMVPLVLFSTAVPLPFGALGVSENASEKLFELVSYQGGAVAMMGYRVVMYAAGLISVVVYLANLRQVRTLRAAEPVEAPAPAAVG